MRSVFQELRAVDLRTWTRLEKATEYYSARRDVHSGVRIRVGRADGFRLAVEDALCYQDKE